MGCCGLPEEGHRGENSRNGMVRGRQYTVVFGNGEKWGYLKPCSKPFLIDADFENTSIDSTSCKVHQSANGGEKSEDKAVGVSRGGNAQEGEGRPSG